MRRCKDNFRYYEVCHEVEPAADSRKSGSLIGKARLCSPAFPVVEIFCPVKNVDVFTSQPIVQNEFLKLDSHEKLSINHSKMVGKDSSSDTKDPRSMNSSGFRISKSREGLFL